MHCLAQQLARVYAEAGKAPDFGLHRFLAGRCGAVVGMAQTVVWKPELDGSVELEGAFRSFEPTLSSEVASHLHGAKGTELEVGFGIARGQGKVMLVLAKATLEVKQTAQEYHRLAWPEPHPVSDEDAFRAEVGRLINGVRTREGMQPIRISEQKSKIVSSVAGPFCSTPRPRRSRSARCSRAVPMFLPRSR